MEEKEKYAVSIFMDFMKKKGVWEKYVYYFKNNKENKGKSVFKFLSSEPYHRFIVGAFEWEKTEEGFSYWYDLDCEWENYYESIDLEWERLKENTIVLDDVSDFIRELTDSIQDLIFSEEFITELARKVEDKINNNCKAWNLDDIIYDKNEVDEKLNEDNIINPSHYKSKNPEPIDVILNWKLSYLEGNVLKYLARWKEKNGVIDLKKAQWYLNKLIEMEEKND